MLLCINLGILLLTSIIVLSLLKIRSRVTYLLGSFLIICTEVAVVFQILSLLSALSKWLVFTSQLIVLLFVITLWVKNDKPELAAPLRTQEFLSYLGSLKTQWQKHLPVLILVIGVSGLLLVVGWTAWFTYDEFIDTVLYHYPKVALWVQNRSILFTPDTAAYIQDTRIIGSPPVGDMGYLWSFFWLDSIRSINIFEFIAIIPAMIAIYGVSLLLTGKRRASFIAALMFPTFELVIWNMSHANGVISGTAFLISALHFILTSLNQHNKINIVFASLGLALAISTKPSFYFLMPLTAILLIINITKGWKSEGAKWPRSWFLLGGGALLTICAVIWIQNGILYKDPLMLHSFGSQEEVDMEHPLNCIPINIARFSYDRTNFHITATDIETRIKETIIPLWEFVSGSIGLDLTSDACTEGPFDWRSDKPGYGLLFIPLLLTAIPITTASDLKEKTFKRSFLWLTILSFVIFYFTNKGYRVSRFRYFATSAALFSILLADLFNRIREKRLLLSLIFIISLYGAFSYTIIQVNESLGEYSVIEIIQGVDSRENRDKNLAALLPQGTTILGTFQRYDSIDSAFFGDDLSRNLEFSDCKNLYYRLKETQPDFFLFESAYPDWDPGACFMRTDIPDISFRDYLNANYTPVYQSWQSFRYTLIYARNETGVQQYNAFPPGYPVIIINDSINSVISGGPEAFFERSVGLSSEEFMFGLRAEGNHVNIQTTIAFSGEACTIEDILRIYIVDSAGNVISDDEFQLEDNSLHLAINLNHGSNRIFIDEPDCILEVNTPLLIETISIGE